ncbi:transmembrane 4 L6 family member 18-like [Colossoma macropomum]|uniref:transmembrane 4 L6 family member 18-like n=1 Tax=Colossoma macropomum TaxID=42526 RepID=UPI0018645AA3|nr:transmembrane 4 L6 family member 18-like [Colossoma macropomum]
MCNQKGLCVTTVFLYPLAITSIICSILLFFPGWSYEYFSQGKLTTEVRLSGGLVGGLVVLIPAFFVQKAEKCLCCCKCCGPCLSVLLEALGVVGAMYSFGVALSGLLNGPYCKGYWTWGTPFKGQGGSYLHDQSQWSTCSEPEDVVKFNVILFSILLAISSLKIIFCSSHIICILVSCLCLPPTALVAAKAASP